MVLIAIMIIGLALLVLEIWCIVNYFLIIKNSAIRSRWFLISFATFILGGALAYYSPNYCYYLSRDIKIIGIPFVAVVFERSGNHWADFVGPLTSPSYYGNMIVSFMFPQTVLAIGIMAKRKCSNVKGT